MQNFFRSYKKLAGMTGTAETESSEFQNIYDLPVTVVPTNQKVRRTDESDVVFRTEEGKVQCIGYGLWVQALGCRAWGFHPFVHVLLCHQGAMLAKLPPISGRLESTD